MSYGFALAAPGREDTAVLARPRFATRGAAEVAAGVEADHYRHDGRDVTEISPSEYAISDPRDPSRITSKIVVREA